MEKLKFEFSLSYIYIYRDSASVESTRGASLTLAPITHNARALHNIYIRCHSSHNRQTQRGDNNISFIIAHRKLYNNNN